LSFDAFKALQMVFIKKLKQQTCWAILRYFGYDDKLQIKSSLWDDKTVADEDLESCKNVELSRDGLKYLRRMFDAFKNS
jgi:hypothetical protein